MGKLEKSIADNKYLKMQIQYLNEKNKSFSNLDIEKKYKKQSKKVLSNEEDEKILISEKK